METHYVRTNSDDGLEPFVKYKERMFVVLKNLKDAGGHSRARRKGNFKSQCEMKNFNCQCGCNFFDEKEELNTKNVINKTHIFCLPNQIASKNIRILEKL